MDCSRCESNLATRPAARGSALINGLCEGCYLYTYVVPLQKERENSEKIVASLTKQIQHFLGELHKAKHVDQLSSEEASRRMLERQKRVQRGELVALGYQYCAKCHAPFELAIERIMHEEDCHILKPTKQGKVKRVSAATVTREITDLEEMA